MKHTIYKALKWSEKYTKTDMLYIANGIFWWGFGKTGAFFISFITIIAFANWLPKESYGTYQFITATLSLFVIFCLPGINTTTIKSIAQKKEGTLDLALKEKIKWGGIGSLFSIGLAIWYFLTGNNLLAIAFFLGSFFIPFWPTFGIFNFFWNGRKRFDIQAKYNIISGVLSAIMLILAIYLTNNVITILFVFLGSQTISNWFFYSKTKKQVINQDKDYKAISFGKSLTLMSAIEKIANHIDKIIIWNFLGAAPLAVYSVAYLPVQKILLSLPIMPLSLPKLGEKRLNKERKKSVISKFLYLFIISIPTTIILIFISPFIYKLVFPQYIDSVIYFQALSLLIALSPIILLNAILISNAEQKAIYITQIIPSVLKIILFFIFLFYFGTWGIIISILITEVIKGLLIFYYFVKIKI